MSYSGAIICVVALKHIEFIEENEIVLPIDPMWFDWSHVNWNESNDDFFNDFEWRQMKLLFKTVELNGRKYFIYDATQYRDEGCNWQEICKSIRFGRLQIAIESMELIAWKSVGPANQNIVETARVTSSYEID